MAVVMGPENSPRIILKPPLSTLRLDSITIPAYSDDYQYEPLLKSVLGKHQKINKIASNIWVHSKFGTKIYFYTNSEDWFPRICHRLSKNDHNFE